MKKVITVSLFIILALTSYWLMSNSLTINSLGLQVGGKYWSDFGAQLPLIRSFSLGSNWPPEHPLFPGEPIRYHFLFYQLVAAWESIGLPLNTALNFPSILGLISLSVLVWLLSFRLFKSYFVSFLSVLFIFLNASLSWLEFLKAHPLNDLPSLASFPAFGPWNGSLISAFWNLNIYTNQRHLAYSLALVTLLIYNLSTARRLVYLTGFLIGLLLLFNQPAAVMAAIFSISYFVIFPKLRFPLFVSLIGFIPWLIAYQLLLTPPTLPFISPGFLIPKPLTIFSFINYWLVNFGPHLVLIPLGLLLSFGRSKVFIVPLLILFIVPNIWQFSPDIINNHKLFNYYLIIGGIFSAYAIYRLKYLGWLLLPFVILGGIVDIFPIKNDHLYTLNDFAQSPDIRFFTDQTPKNATVLNSTWFYHPASLAGRKIFNGYSYFTWSYGYDQTRRESITKSIYSATSKSLACQQLLSNHIDYVELNSVPESFIQPNLQVWTQFIPQYRNTLTNLTIYNVAINCHD